MGPLAPSARRALQLVAAGLAGVAVTASIGWARVGPGQTPAPAASDGPVREVVLYSSDPHATNLVIGDAVDVRQLFGLPFHIGPDVHALVVVVVAPDAGGPVSCRIVLAGETVAQESGDGPRSVAACVWPPGTPDLTS